MIKDYFENELIAKPKLECRYAKYCQKKTEFDKFDQMAKDLGSWDLPNNTADIHKSIEPTGFHKLLVTGDKHYMPLYSAQF
jgi:hypothetical protein